MNITLIIMVLLLSIWKADWKNWEAYYPTMLYISLSSFVYEFISHSHFHLWEIEEDGLFNLMNVHFVHNLIINPLVALVFLSHYPSKLKIQIIYTIKWVFIFWLLEWIASWVESITYYNGWHIWWSLLFLVVMFLMIRLHHVNKLRGILLSFLCSVLLLFVFDYI